MELDGTIASSRDPAAPSPSIVPPPAVASRRCWLLSRCRFLSMLLLSSKSQCQHGQNTRQFIKKGQEERCADKITTRPKYFAEHYLFSLVFSLVAVQVHALNLAGKISWIRIRDKVLPHCIGAPTCRLGPTKRQSNRSRPSSISAQAVFTFYFFQITPFEDVIM